ncbi:uncharacterized protein LOC120768578 [Bactrocera tryoni]|uniref:uncharacterized protein LOC120768578 n=1 Tax=Bactrocera tryoni TaxID=59916 RepID=UPI001A97B2E4|nr:uncharacterized protein LOC120768578 [Bactrocera tryoni]XP_039951267.1 uncharacterized protein LOC120768578 [Bactrocera tryoni]XP_039951268.1 uncharacterized protein LOC120768578 [Bactrocera tryoni]
MYQVIRFLFFCLLGLGFLKLSPAQVTQEYTGESLRSLIFAVNQLDNKFERHEHRERALGEVIKKSLTSLQRGQLNLERLYGTQSHFDQRFSETDFHLKAQEERLRNRIETFFTEQDKTNQRLLEQLTKLSLNVEKLLDNSNDLRKPSNKESYSIDWYERQKSPPYIHLNDKRKSNEELYSSINYNLSRPIYSSLNYSLSRPTAQQLLKYPGFDSNVLVKSDEPASQSQQPCAQPTSQNGLTDAVKIFFHELTNETHNLLHDVNTNVQNMVQKSQTEVMSRLQEVEQSLHTDAEEITKTLNIHEISLQEFHSEMINTFNKVNDSFETLSRCNSVSKPRRQVMDTEASASDLATDKQPEQMQLLDLLKTHFDTIHQNMTNIQLEMATNLSATIKNEISFLWRQISITNGEINDSRDLLRLMRDRNEIFVNSILQSIAAISLKVVDIKERVMDMSDYQNYLSNKLPLLPQEFADMQQAFIGWLEQLSETIKIVQETKNGWASKILWK